MSYSSEDNENQNALSDQDLHFLQIVQPYFV